MDIPFEGQFNGYGVNAGQPAAGAPPPYDAEVRARATQMRAPSLGGAAAAEAPKPTAIPSWLQRSGMFATRGASLVGQGVGMAARMFGIGASGLGIASLLTHSSDAGAGSDYQVGNGTPATPDQLAQAKESAAGGVQAGNPFPKAFPSPADIPAAAAPAAADAGFIGKPWDGSPGAEMSQEAMGKANLATAMKAGFGARAVADNALRTGMTPPGTGGIRNNQTGQVTGITPSGYGARGPVQIDRLGNQLPAGGDADLGNRGLLGGFVSSMGAIGQANVERRQQNFDAKLGVEAGAKGAEAAKHIAEATNFRLRTRAAEEHLKANPGDYTTAASIAAGRSQGNGAVYHESTTSVPDVKTGAVVLINGRTGAATKVTPSQRVSDANIAAYIKDNPGTSRQKAIDLHKQKGMDVSGLK